MKLYFVRHGQTLGNVTGDFSTTAHGVLTDKGVEQAELLADRLAHYQFDLIYSSPFDRAVKTIAPYLKRNGRQAELWPELCEGCWQEDWNASVPKRQKKAKPLSVDEDLNSLFHWDENAHFPHEDEVYHESAQRFAQGQEKLLARHAGQKTKILLVGHWYQTNRYLEGLMKLPRADYERFHHNNTGLSYLFERRDGKFMLEFLNRTN